MSGDHHIWDHGPEDAKKAAHEATKPVIKHHWFKKTTGDHILTAVKILIAISIAAYVLMHYHK